MSAMWGLWWVWMSAALLLGILEVLLPAFIFLGFAVGAFGVGQLLLILGPDRLGLAWLLVVFAVLSALAYVALRYFFGLRKGQVRIWKRDINKD
jgi:inner membrane protein